MAICIVMFKSDTTKDQMADYLNHVQENGATIKHFYESIKGVALEMDSCEASFVKDPIVESIEPDGTVSTSSKFRF
ncbi:unnamed protein product [Rhizoctonia solani]|uniref:Inhibitor I9 domain-containing protein n=1 Tax=Rhizoctonia solani TaxID=456999 RepID=A0A8H2WZI5_9AGAM|nr:unnamed protein product [Rhizoctonia solani]CAE6515370.1 unnamed protein product [Rhizoctonia solani]